MPINRDELIEKLADRMTEAADLDSLMSYFKEGQIAWLDDMTEPELIEYANDFLGYNIEEEV